MGSLKSVMNARWLKPFLFGVTLVASHLALLSNAANRVSTWIHAFAGPHLPLLILVNLGGYPAFLTALALARSWASFKASTSVLFFLACQHGGGLALANDFSLKMLYEGILFGLTLYGVGC
jgi:hypothetical protein